MTNCCSFSTYDMAVTNDFLVTLNDANTLRYYRLDSLSLVKEITSSRDLQSSYGVQMIQFSNQLLSFFTGVDSSRITDVMMNELLFQKDSTGSPVDFSTSNSGVKYQWIVSEEIHEIKLNLNTKIKAILGGQALGWLDIPEKQFEQVRVCSYSEFYNSTTNTCEPCLKGTNIKGWINDGTNSTGTGPFFSKSIQSELCYDCADLDTYTSDWKLYLKLAFLCQNKDYLKGHNSSITVHGYSRYDPTLTELKEIEILEKKEKESSSSSIDDTLDSIKDKF